MKATPSAMGSVRCDSAAMAPRTRPPPARGLSESRRRCGVVGSPEAQITFLGGLGRRLDGRCAPTTQYTSIGLVLCRSTSPGPSHLLPTESIAEVLNSAAVLNPVALLAPTEKKHSDGQRAAVAAAPSITAASLAAAAFGAALHSANPAEESATALPTKHATTPTST